LLTCSRNARSPNYIGIAGAGFNKFNSYIVAKDYFLAHRRNLIENALPHRGYVGQNATVSRVNRATAAQSLSVSLTVGAYGIAFGAASVAAGFSVWQSCLLSLLTFTGASQFAVVGVLGAGGSALSGIATATLLGVRNTLYGLRMAPVLNVKGLRRIFAAQITIDESTGVALSQEKIGLREMRQGFWLTGFGVFVFWNIFSFGLTHI
jgi:predicted branched-subunit amino acid permease